MDLQQPTPRPQLLDTLERLLAIEVIDLETALTHSCNLIAETLHADKVDAFLYQPDKDTLFALGTSTQPLSALQRKLGLDVLPVSNGGRVVHVFQTGQTFATGRLDEDPEELRGVKEALNIRSKVGVPLDMDGHRRGMVMIASLEPNFFTNDDVRLAQSIVRWVAVVARKAELSQQIARNALEQGRREVADELITVLAHDLRNFLGPITARLHLLRRRAAKENRDIDVRDCEAAERGVNRVNRLIADLLDVARLDQGVFQLGRGLGFEVQERHRRMGASRGARSRPRRIERYSVENLRTVCRRPGLSRPRSRAASRQADRRRARR